VKIPKAVLFILKTLNSSGYEAFIVGGCVRDLIRGCVPKDWDIATSALPQQVKALFQRTFDTGIQHGTVTVLAEGGQFEVTTYRVDGEYLDGRRPVDVTFSAEIEADLARRDFTINAIAYNVERGFVDPFDGRGDIARGVIRCVGNAECRFGEDALRMLRAVRFAAVLGFAVDENAIDAIAKLKKNLENISAERVREELIRTITGMYPNAVSLLESTGLMYHALQNRDFLGDLQAIISQLEQLQMLENCSTTTAITLFLQNFSENSELKKILHDLRFDNKTIKNVSLFMQFFFEEIPCTRYEIKKILNIMPAEMFEDLVLLKEIAKTTAHAQKLIEIARDISAKKECYTLRDLAINGDDLRATGISDGKKIGETLARLLDMVMQKPWLNTKESLLTEAVYEARDGICNNAHETMYNNANDTVQSSAHETAPRQ